ncbi:substrate-binding periplasmic protein [Nitrincola alkalilacustris]|uniref:substrate-binding periplasmic protein n=1 Tax=Nitrincola alkalilacustris TaxID=1571224 RepID=UPI00124E6086|nr:transporter substrate-binding domain-containing protein [Nitrincola alkalilacustris]
MFLKARLLLLCLLIFISCSSQVFARELRVGLGELDYPPFYFKENGQFKGAAVEIAEQIAAQLGHQLVYVRYPWARVQNALEFGDLDMMILYFRTPERESKVVYTETPHLNESSHLFVRSNSNIDLLSSLDDLEDRLFGHVRGYAHGEQYDNHQQLKKHLVPDERHLIRTLIVGGIDVAVGNKPAIMMVAELEGLEDEIVFLNTPIDIGPNFFAFSRVLPDAEALARDYSEQLRQFMPSDEYRQILMTYGFDLTE